MTTHTSDGQVAEIVTFRLKDGVSDTDYLALTHPSHAFVSYARGFVTRRLSKGADGTWTDYTIWQSLDDAKAAQADFMAQDFAPAMVGAIDGDTMRMEHQQVLWAPG
ncbi:hypothetical protein C8N43_1157 [Litoreibacter ponti]|uniref:Antibiotic biosynthesis monooxygenase n=1 Tax=Litoreibacter ponti TaxID=1510457 RepID=A0A2T6BKB5_9RHOB|nr:hypothetical protein [Litoreibacter ponti]PTX56498.1 hypothetical protein C8N43_1157 [Litoreibacter ponti]